MHHPSPLRRAGRLAVAIAALGSSLALAAAPASATPDDSDTVVFVPTSGSTSKSYRNADTATAATGPGAKVIVGDFSSAAGTDAFIYNPGGGQDGILHANVDPGGGTSLSFKAAGNQVSGTYQVIVGDFDGNAIDDLLFYAPGATADSLWLFKADGSHTTKALTINGTYQPTAINVDGDGDTDVIWYAPGTAADTIWRFGANGSYTQKALTINGTYTLIPGFFGQRPEGSPQRRLIFFSKSGADSIWTFDTSANHTSTGLSNIDGAFTPIVGNFVDEDNESVLFYRPGTASERFIGFNDAGELQQFEAPNVNGTYLPTVADVDGNRLSDIVWSTSNGTAAVWKFNGGGYANGSISGGPASSRAFGVPSFRFPK